MGKTTIWKEHRFEAAHYLPDVPDGHKCRRLHGHSYRVVLTVQGDVGRYGFAGGVDYADISKLFDELVFARCDHQLLNEVCGALSNPTSENLARWIYDQLHRPVSALGPVSLVRVHIQESPTAGATYEP